MKPKAKLFDMVALTQDLPEEGLSTGQVGAIVEVWERGVFEVEFSDQEGKTYAMLALREDQILVLRYAPASAA
jgi:hypothetical protein